MPIELPGYGAVFENSVYAKGVEKTATTPQGTEQVSCRQILIPTRYTKPSEDQVVEYLRVKADEIDATARIALPQGFALSGKSTLEIAMLRLPRKIRDDLRTGYKECTDFVRSHTRAPAVEERDFPNKYVHIRFGVLPAETIELNQAAGRITEAGWYTAALSDERMRSMGLGERWAMQLLYDACLPDRGEMDVLLNHGTHGSRTLDITRINYSLDEVRGVIDVIYAALPTDELIEQLPDVSARLLEELSLEPVIAFHEMLHSARESGQTQLPQPTRKENIH